MVSTRMNWSDIFTARGLRRHLLIVVVRILVTVQVLDTGTTGRTMVSVSWPHEQRRAA